jgi:hypothetical protein
MHPELAHAALDHEHVVVQVDGDSYKVDHEDINPYAVELACDQQGCALIPDDGNPYNDIVVNTYGDD